MKMESATRLDNNVYFQSCLSWVFNKHHQIINIADFTDSQ